MEKDFDMNEHFPISMNDYFTTTLADKVMNMVTVESKNTYEAEIEGVKFRYGFMIDGFGAKNHIKYEIKVVPAKESLSDACIDIINDDFETDDFGFYEIESEGFYAMIEEVIFTDCTGDVSKFLNDVAETVIKKIQPDIENKLKEENEDEDELSSWEFLKQFIKK